MLRFFTSCEHPMKYNLFFILENLITLFITACLLNEGKSEYLKFMEGNDRSIFEGTVPAFV